MFFFFSLYLALFFSPLPFCSLACLLCSLLYLALLCSVGVVIVANEGMVGLVGGMDVNGTLSPVLYRRRLGSVFLFVSLGWLAEGNGWNGL